MLLTDRPNRLPLATMDLRWFWLFRRCRSLLYGLRRIKSSVSLLCPGVWWFVFYIRYYFNKSNSGLFQGTTSISFTFWSFCIVILFVVCQFEWNEFTINFTVTNRDEAINNDGGINKNLINSSFIKTILMMMVWITKNKSDFETEGELEYKLNLWLSRYQSSGETTIAFSICCINLHLTSFASLWIRFDEFCT